MNLLSKIVLFSALSLSSVYALSVNTIKQDLQLDSDNLNQLEINVGAGSLVVKGDSNSSEIFVEATINGTKIDDEDYELYLRRHGDKAFLFAHFNQAKFGNNHIDLTVSVPHSLRLRVQDNSGDIVIEGMRSRMRIEDTSGDLEITDVVGDVIIEDSSGDIELRSIQGDVDIDDRSGDINVRNIAGNVVVKDGSGDIEIFTVEGSVTAEDGSGDIVVSEAVKFTLERDGSGDVILQGVGS